MRLYLLRHGTTDFNDLDLMLGSGDIGLNDNGVKDVYEVREKLKKVRFDLCISSPLKRTYQTANIVIGGKCKIVFDDMIRERNLGLLEGKSRKLYAKYDYWDYNLNTSANGVEPVKSLLRRAGMFLRKLKKQYGNKTILVVSHSAVIRAIHYNIVGYDNNTRFLDFKVPTASFFLYDL